MYSRMPETHFKTERLLYSLNCNNALCTCAAFDNDTGFDILFSSHHEDSTSGSLRHVAMYRGFLVIQVWRKQFMTSESWGICSKMLKVQSRTQEKCCRENVKTTTTWFAHRCLDIEMVFKIDSIAEIISDLSKLMHNSKATSWRQENTRSIINALLRHKGIASWALAPGA